MKKFFLKNKSLFLSGALKLMGVCGVLILFEACYGTPKSAFVPKHDKKNVSAKSAQPITDKEKANRI
ncbi:MAG TPA: hypothetical protein PKK00_11705 [Bacteroidales bacterium]|nr:hypothetical protein [Bacteroidales bacterium]HPS17394.1 hypothetical protein [Bacteroidales bacterium]